MKKALDILRRIGGTIMLPVAMYLIMYLICGTDATGKALKVFSNPKVLMMKLPELAVTVSCAMGIGLQFKNGRFDFSGGAIMLLAAIVAGNAGLAAQSSAVFAVTAVAVCVVLSVLVALVYVYGRLPIMIATIGMALVYEAITSFGFGGGVNLVSVSYIKALSQYPTVLLPFVGAVLVYAFYNYLSVSGKRSVLLAKNQQAGVNIGINENREVIISYVYSGLIFGFATIVWASLAKRDASFSSLSTVGALFSNILPVFVGLYIGAFCGDTIGIIMASVAIVLMKFGLTTVLKGTMGEAVSTAMMGLFVFLVNFVAGQSQGIKKTCLRLLRTLTVTHRSAKA